MSCVCALIACCVLHPAVISAGLLDRVVAVVNDKVILLSDLEREIAASGNSAPALPAAGILNELINRQLLLDEAVKFRMNALDPDDQSVIDLFIERRIRSLIHIRLSETEAYYTRNSDSYGDSPFYDVKDEIESSLVEKELKIRLGRHIEELRKKAYIRIQLDDSDAGNARQ